jgi:phosphohistidine phosphatase SixA
MRKIIFVRHAKAIKAEKFGGIDQDRYLTKSGKKDLNSILKIIKNELENADAIYTSPYLRALETALLINKITKKKIQLLNQITPYDSPASVINWLHTNLQKNKFIIIVGHEPHLAKTISKLIGINHRNIKVNKSAFICLRYKKDKLSQLLWQIDSQVICCP